MRIGIVDPIGDDAMSPLISRPKRGLAPEAALAKWSDAALYKELVALAGTDDLPPAHLCEHVSRDPARQKEYRAKREHVEEAFRTKLQDGEILSSAIPKYSNAREIFDPSLWDLLYVSYELNEVVGGGRRYETPEFFIRTEIPLNVRNIPTWLDTELAAAGLNHFSHDHSYRHIVLNGHQFALSELHAKVVTVLHQAALAGEPWQHGQSVLEKAGSRQLKMVDVFKSRNDWRTFIDSDGKGMYRLKIPEPSTSS